MRTRRPPVIAAATAVLVLVGVGSTSAMAAVPPGLVQFTATGASQHWTVPAGVTRVHVDARGAQGGGIYGGFGGRVQADLTVTPGVILDIEVGTQATGAHGGYNGGGTSAFEGLPVGSGPGGGGSTDIRTVDGDVTSRLVVAGGGGGGPRGPINGMGGSAGLLTGQSGVGGGPGLADSAVGGGGGTQSGGGLASGDFAGSGALGQGGTGGDSGGAGGGGYYGGGGSSGGGGAGSSWADPTKAVAAQYEQGVQRLGGSLTLTWGGAAGSGFAASGPVAFRHVGSPQLWQVPDGTSVVTAALEGGDGGGLLAGVGQRITGKVPVTPGQQVAVMVGGAGVPAGAFNGGGASTFFGDVLGESSGGGGATDIRVGGWLLTDRVLVAGGGGGSGGSAPDYGTGGSAGRPAGAAGADGSDRWHGGGGGTQNSGGAGGGSFASDGILARGGAGGFYAGAGGGGYYGGGGGGGDSYGGTPAGGGGGSSWSAPQVTGSTVADRTAAGDGIASLTGASTPTPTPSASATPTPRPTATPPPPGTTPKTYVALGDSYASGEGAPDSAFLPGTSFLNSDGITEGCHRSYTSFANTLARDQNLPSSQWSFVACSGAVVDNITHINERWKPKEIEQAQSDSVTSRTTTASIIIGGNDVGFERIVGDCTYSGLGGDGLPGCRSLRRIARTTADSGLAETRARLVPLFRQLATRMANGGTLYVAGYPRFFSSNRRYFLPLPDRSGKFHLACLVNPLGAGVTFDDAQWINSVIDRGDQAIHDDVDAVAAYLRSNGYSQRIVYVPVDPDFHGHRLCDSPPTVDSGYRHINGVLLAGTTPRRQSYHPNTLGQADYVRAFRKVMGRP